MKREEVRKYDKGHSEGDSWTELGGGGLVTRKGQRGEVGIVNIWEGGTVGERGLGGGLKGGGGEW
jgi:hypothetical protein